MAEVEWALLCDYAFLDANGKMCLIGVFNNFNVRRVPTMHPRAALVVQMRGIPKESWRLRIEIVRPGGSVLQKVEGQGAIGEQGGAGIALTLQPVQLPDAGSYSINIGVNDEPSYKTGFAVLIPETRLPS